MDRIYRRVVAAIPVIMEFLVQVEPPVYFIDSDDTTCETMRPSLCAAGYRVFSIPSMETLPDIHTGYGCMIIDIGEGTLSPCLSHLRQRGIDLPIIATSRAAEIPMVVDAMRRGVVDFLVKPFSVEQLLASVELAVQRGPTQLQIHDENAEEIARRMEALSSRERDVLRGLLAGYSNKVIAHHLGISPRTVEIHRANLMSKMHADTLSALVAMALVNGRRGHVQH